MLKSKVYQKSWANIDFYNYENQVGFQDIVQYVYSLANFYLIIGMNENISSKYFYGKEKYELYKSEILELAFKSKAIVKNRDKTSTAIFYLTDQKDVNELTLFCKSFSYVSMNAMRVNTNYQEVGNIISKFSFFDILGYRRWEGISYCSLFIDVEHSGLTLSSQDLKKIEDCPC